MKPNIFKFGGASVHHAEGVRNMAGIVEKYRDRGLIVIVSAMGKTTNALESVLKYYMDNDPIALIEKFREIEHDHFSLARDLFSDPAHPVFGELDSLFNQLRGYIRKGHLYTPEKPGFDHEYDQIVSFGELFSTCIIHHYLVYVGLDARYHDVRELIRTDDTFREARIDWEETTAKIRKQFVSGEEHELTPGIIHITQGFIAGGPGGITTTLGREGSDYSAAIFAYSLNINEMVIWKDVPGVMNADPKWMPDAIRLETLSYREAVELAYYGASVIHPKTIRPLENANIILHVKSFLAPDTPGTRIGNLSQWRIETPVYIRKTGQMLISLSARDFSFILEENLGDIFATLARFKVKVNLMHNSAISFTICIDHDPHRTTPLLEYLGGQYEIRYNSPVSLITIRHYDDHAVTLATGTREVLMDLRSRTTCQLVIRE